jgi:diguanylate cyclase (GGDEF)-like protein
MFFFGRQGDHMFHEKENLSQTITSLLRSSAQDDWALIAGLEFLASTHGKEVYDEFFYVLTQRRFGTEKAISHWNNVISHMDYFVKTQYLHQGLLPTIIHYLQKKTGVMSDIRFLESDFIDNIQRSSITDGLTGLYNQTFFKNTLAKLISQLHRHGGSSLSVVLFDLDNFKHYNDTLGHLAGDHALKNAATIIHKSLRGCDIAARYGGEEFALLLPQTSKSMALKVANRIRQAIEKASFQGQELTPSKNLTISGGVAEMTKDLMDAETLIDAADRELYKAKTRRNCICPNIDDRRRGIRRPVKSLVEYALNGESVFRPALSVDISEVGVALGCDWKLEVDSPVRLKFKKPYWTDDIDVNAIVRQTKIQGDLNFIGLEFNRGFPGVLSYFH